MKKQSNSRHCFVCGVDNLYGLHMTFFNEGPGTVVAQITVPEQFQGYPGIVHGGIIAAMLDEVGGRSASAEPTRWLVTATINVRYRRPVPIGKPLKLIGRLIQDSGRVLHTTSQILDEENIVLADAEVVLAEVPARMRESLRAMPQDEWMVYPDEE